MFAMSTALSMEENETMGDETEVKEFTPPFIFRVTFQLRPRNLRFKFDVVAVTSSDAVEIATEFLIMALKAAINAQKLNITDARPVFYEIDMIRQFDGDEALWQ